MLDKPVYTKAEIQKILAEREQEWKFNFLKDFQAGLSLGTDMFKKLLESWVSAVNSLTGRLPSAQDLSKFIDPVFPATELAKKPEYRKILDEFIQKLSPPPKAPAVPATPAAHMPEASVRAFSPVVSAQEMDESGMPGSEDEDRPSPFSATAATTTAPVRTPSRQAAVSEPAQASANPSVQGQIIETIPRPCTVFNQAENEVMTAVLRKYFSDQVAGIVKNLRPELLQRIAGFKNFHDYRPFFPLLARTLQPSLVTNETFFSHGWQEYVEMSKKMYLSLKRGTPITNIRPGSGPKNFARSGYYGLLLTMEYCADELKEPDFDKTYNFCLHYFTLAMEKDPDEVMEEARFMALPAVTEIFKTLLSTMLAAKSGPGHEIMQDFSRSVSVMKVLNSAQDKTQELFQRLKKYHTISLIYNYAAMLSGQHTAVGWTNEKSELLSWDHPKVLERFKDIAVEPEWTLDSEITQTALHINMLKSSPGVTDPFPGANFIRAVLECIRAELPLLNATSLIRGRNVKQGMERELTETRYFEPVLKFLSSARDLIQETLRKYKGR
jgi:hypothetical protein